MATIQKLPPEVVNKIAAGEVIERPASVVKELVENALDAGATRIEVSVEKGGAESIRVTDNGCGIAAEQLPLAVAPHATSKICNADDLFRIATLGFRGEALASIAAVSHLCLTSRPAEADEGATLRVEAGRIGEVVPCGTPPGTTVEVRNLFVNTPVRRKFLRTTQTEMGHVAEAVVRLALAHPDVHFTLNHGRRRVHELPAGETWLARIGRLFGRELADGLISVESCDEQVRLFGYVAPPNHSRGNQRMQFLLLNGRFIRDRSLQHALSEAYRGLLMHGRYPIAFLRLDMPPELVDVNVHPTKLEVRFQDGGRIYSQVLGTLRTRFLSTDLTVPLDAARAQTPPHVGSSHPPSREAGSEVDDRRRELAEWAQREMGRSHPHGATGSEPVGPMRAADVSDSVEGQRDHRESPSADEPLALRRLGRNWSAEEARAQEERRARDEALFSFTPRDATAPGSPLAANAPAEGATATNDAHLLGLGNRSTVEPTQGGPDMAAADSSLARPRAIQVHNRYLVAESEEGVLVIDQHALHERVLYEQLREKVLAGAVEAQALLVPEPVDLTPLEAAALLEQRELLAQLGLRVEPFGGDTVLLTSFPAMLANLKADDVLRSLAGQLVEGQRKPERRDLLDELLHMMACKAAIKAGDRLTPEEVAALVEQRHLVRDSHHCPHGRPTALVFTRDELDRQFKRT